MLHTTWPKSKIGSFFTKSLTDSLLSTQRVYYYQTTVHKYKLSQIQTPNQIVRLLGILSSYQLLNILTQWRLQIGAKWKYTLDHLNSSNTPNKCVLPFIYQNQNIKILSFVLFLAEYTIIGFQASVGPGLDFSIIVKGMHLKLPLVLNSLTVIENSLNDKLLTVWHMWCTMIGCPLTYTWEC